MSMTNRESIQSAIYVLWFALALLTVPGLSQAQEQSDFSEEEMRAFIQDQFSTMYKKAVDSASERLAEGEAIKAYAVVADRNNEFRLLRIDKVESFPPDVALEVMRRSLRVLVKNGGVGATCLVYVAPNPNKESEAEFVLVAEMEHLFGPTLAQLTPYSFDEGTATFGKPVAVESEPSIFVFKKQNQDTTEKGS